MIIELALYMYLCHTRLLNDTPCNLRKETRLLPNNTKAKYKEDPPPPPAPPPTGPAIGSKAVCYGLYRDMAELIGRLYWPSPKFIGGTN